LSTIDGDGMGHPLAASPHVNVCHDDGSSIMMRVCLWATTVDAGGQRKRACLRTKVMGLAA
jgi:hypothetical protein